LLSSCAAQKSPVPRWLYLFDVFGLIPNCRFFAPRPVSLDLALYCRCAAFDKAGVGWHSVLPQRKAWCCFLWNPQHRIRKMLHDLLELLQNHMAIEGKDTLYLAYPYLVLLNVSAAELSCSEGPHTQFAITAHAGHEDDVQNLVFVSNLHRR